MIKIQPVTALQDNYIWLINKENTPFIVIIDPGDAKPVLSAINRSGFEPLAILITHHHSDHTGGVKEIIQTHDIPVYGPANEAISSITHPVSEGDKLEFDGLGYSLNVMNVPGHTRGHLAYYNDDHLFCGDTLFTGGCGMVFDGTIGDLFHSLVKIACLPDNTLVFCAHEYTLDNLKFALVVEPENPELKQRYIHTRATRKLGKPTVPSILALEKATNPFLRCHLPGVIQAAEAFALKTLQSDAETFKVVRHWKDTLD
ncbi:MAG TPA: hydroxyacylglutathione hydrolase [Gammaproteobacteria bacterium]|nr:hydroxyacylglutathione hydrolase [Gammaproteobacteria bacterium]